MNTWSDASSVCITKEQTSEKLMPFTDSIWKQRNANNMDVFGTNELKAYEQEDRLFWNTV